MKQIWVEPQEIWIDAKFSTSEEALSAMANHLVNRGICKPSFVEAILNREREFPTGLETLSGIGVALPHTDAEHVLCDRLAIAILEREIPFGAMGFEQEKVEVKLIVMMAIAEADAHLSVLRRLSDLLMEDSLLKRLSTAKEAGVVKKIFEELLQEA